MLRNEAVFRNEELYHDPCSEMCCLTSPMGIQYCLHCNHTLKIGFLFCATFRDNVSPNFEAPMNFKLKATEQ